MVTGSKRKVYVFGAVTKKKKQIFLTLDDRKVKGKSGRPKNGEKKKKKMRGKFNHKTTLKFLYLLKNRLGRFLLIWDKAGFHTDNKVMKYIERNKDSIRVISLPTAAPELNPVEECWRQGKGDVSGNKIYDSYEDFHTAVKTYYKNRRFNLNISHYLCH